VARPLRDELRAAVFRRPRIRSAGALVLCGAPPPAAPSLALGRVGSARRYSPVVVTDPVPRGVRLRRQYEASDAQHTLELPPAGALQRDAERLRTALEAAKAPEVRRAGQELLDHLAEFYRLPAPKLKVLGVRPHRVRDGHLESELHGDYTLETGVLRAWMRTAMLGKVTSYRGMLNTLLHVFAHHLDVQLFGWPDTPHTRGFYWRVDALYHLALGTPPEKRKPLVWIKTGTRWRIDWSRLR
jgi:hypothetical protein